MTLARAATLMLEWILSALLDRRMWERKAVRVMMARRVWRNERRERSEWTCCRGCGEPTVEMDLIRDVWTGEPHTCDRSVAERLRR